MLPSPLLLLIVIEEVVQEAKGKIKKSIFVLRMSTEMKVTELRVSGNMVILANIEKDVQF